MIICSDNDIIWGTHEVVCHKSLKPEDIEFNLVCTKVIKRTSNATLFSQDILMRDKVIPEQEYKLYVEWGFAQTYLPFDKISEKLKKYLRGYSSPHGSVSIVIPTSIFDKNKYKYKTYCSFKDNILNEENEAFRQELFSCL